MRVSNGERRHWFDNKRVQDIFSSFEDSIVHIGLPISAEAEFAVCRAEFESGLGSKLYDASTGMCGMKYMRDIVHVCVCINQVVKIRLVPLLAINQNTINACTNIGGTLTTVSESS